MQKIFKMCTVLALNCAFVSWAATYTITNKSGNTISLHTAPGSFSVLSSGQSQSFDSGFSEVSQVQWSETAIWNPKAAWEDQLARDLGTYIADISLGTFILGARIDILTGGKYDYDFGVDGHEKGAQAQKIR